MSVLTKDGLLTIANRNNCKAIIFNPGQEGEFEAHLKKCIPEAFSTSEDKQVSCTDIPCLQHLITMAGNQSEELVSIDDLMELTSNEAAVCDARKAVQPDDVLTCYMTSGSTGFPKTIPFTHFSIINHFLTCNLLKGATAGDRYLNDRSLAWAGSLFYMGLTHSVTIVYVHPLAKVSDNDVAFSLKVRTTFYLA